MLPVPLLAALSRLMVPTGAGFLPTVKNQVDKNESEAVAGVGLGEGDGIGVGVGVGLMLLETEPQPISNHELTIKSEVIALRSIKTSQSCDSWIVKIGGRIK
jgi:hypothetical protein